MVTDSTTDPQIDKPSTPVQVNERVQIEVWSDFVCPFCYAAALSLDQLRQTHPIEVQWRAFELRPAGSPPIDPAYKHEIETVKRPYFNRLMRDQYGIEVHEGPFGIVSRAALVMHSYALAQSRALGDAFHSAVTEAYWRQAQDISDLAVLRALAAQVGLDADAAVAAIDSPDYIGQIEADIAQAAAYGLSAVPALVFGGKYLVSGAQPYETLARVADQVKAEQAAAPRAE